MATVQVRVEAAVHECDTCQAVTVRGEQLLRDADAVVVGDDAGALDAVPIP